MPLVRTEFKKKKTKPKSIKTLCRWIYWKLDSETGKLKTRAIFYYLEWFYQSCSQQFSHCYANNHIQCYLMKLLYILMKHTQK